MPITNKEIKDVIRQSLKIDKQEQLDEALIAQKQHFSLPTEFLSKTTKTNHEELYNGYVEQFNKLSIRLDSVDKTAADSTFSEFRSLKLDETYNMNAVYLHELYFANISDLHSNITMDSLAYMRLSRDFGNFDKWQTEFIACCMSSRCGWAMTYYNIFTQTYMNCFIDLHSTTLPIGCFPVIVMDMWQHAYYKDYLNDSKTYIIAMMKELNWEVINDRIKKAEKIHMAMKAS